MARLVQISDCHLFADPQHVHNDVAPYASLCEVIEQVRDLLPDGILITGDISADDTIESYVNLFAILDTHCPGIPFKVIPGNHDNNAHFDLILKGYILTPTEVWNLHNLNVIGLDTRFDKGNGQINPDELQEANMQMLVGNERPWCVAMHHPPYALTGWLKAHECVNHCIFPPWLDTQDNIACVIHGHLHAETTLSAENVPVLGCPSTCWQYSQGEDYGVTNERPGFRLIEVDQFNQLTTEVFRI